MNAKKSNAPPLILILLWHHFCFYKRHCYQLFMLVAFPIIQFLMVWVLAKLMSNGTLGTITEIKENLEEKDIIKLPSFYGPSPLYSQLSLKYTNQDIEVMYRELHSFYQNKSNNSEYYSIRNVSNPTLADYFELCDRVFQPTHKTQQNNKSTISGVLLFYPNNTGSIHSIMNTFQHELLIYLQRAIGYTRFTNDTYLFKRCFGKEAPMLKGFRTYSDALHYAKAQVIMATNDNNTNIKNPLKYLLAIADLTHFSTEPLNLGITYDLIHDREYPSFPYEQGLMVQDVLERAIVRFVAGKNNQTVDVGVEMMPLPNKCWYRTSQRLELLLKFLLALLIIGGFNQVALNCVQLMITERYLKLQEYMSIMGVGKLYLKLSWALFFLLFIVPLTVVAALLIANLPSSPFGGFDVSLLVVVMLLYNFAQLAFCFLLTSIIKKPGQTGFFIEFLLFFFCLIGIFMFNNLKDMHGSFLIFAMLMSLIFTTPITITSAYMGTWAEVWLEAKWNNLFLTPVEFDKYGGIGMCMVWLIVDCVFYLLLSWYIDRVFPGDFGQCHPFYFFLLPSYWCPGKCVKDEVDKGIEGGLELLDKHSTDDGKLGDNQQLEAGIVVDDFTKIYPGGIVGVRNLSIQFPKNSITSFLGHNGAGKSTTMNTIVGLLSPTKGTIYVDGKDVQTSMQQIKQNIAFVPQYDILYPDLTLEEHLQFYGWLKGMSKTEINQQLKPLLEQMDLTKAIKTTATKLSGGQKRKLSLMIAYLGNPAYIILDEPTSGVDPFSRRFIWNMILSHRRGATTILSTHQMDEADLLGDRIAIISSGSLRCYGTSLDLKNKYGNEFQLTVALGADADNKFSSDLQNFITKTFAVSPNQVQLSGNDITAKIPLKMGQSVGMVTALQELDKELLRTGQKISYGVSEPSLEEVFFKASDHGDASAIDTDENNDDPVNLHQSSDQVIYEKQSGVSWLRDQIMGQLLKRFHYTRRSVIGLMYQIIFPILFIAILLIISNKLMGHAANTTTPVRLHKSFYTNVWFYKNQNIKRSISDNFLSSLLETGIGPGCAKGSKLPLSHCNAAILNRNAFVKKGNPSEIPQNCSCRAHCKNRQKYRKILPKVTVPTGDIVYGANDVSNDQNDRLLSRWVYAVNGTKFITIGGFHFKENNTIRLWSKPEQMPAILNGFNNIFARSISGNRDISITMNIRQVQIYEGGHRSRGIQESLVASFGLLFIVLAFASASFGTSLFIMYEKENGLKRLQFIAGANRTIYWLVNFIWDYLSYSITAGIITLMLYSVNNAFTNVVHLVATIAFSYGLMIVSFLYLLSHLLKSYKTVVTLLITSMMICIVVAPYFSNLENEHILICDSIDYCKSKYPWTQILGFILRMFPPYQIADALSVVSMIASSSERYVNQARQRLHQTGPNFPPMSTSEALSIVFQGSVFQYKVLGKCIFSAMIIGAFYLMLTVLIETLGGQCSGKNYFWKKTSPKLVDLDQDVKAEEADILKAGRSNDPLQVRNITKYYSSMPVPAVNNVTFGMRRSQCFGLLGVNGAGKTTLFRMTTGYLAPSSGTAFIEQKDMYKNPGFAESKIMYCPQDNTLYDSLTIREHLEIFSKFLSIPDHEAKNIIRKLVNEIDLQSHENKLAHRLSGGNQRKLQFALAIMGYPSIIFLDEPTSGMDPGARRCTWKAIQRAIQNRGCSVMLTSHSMEECEALCHRLVIMVAGNLQCIGSIQYLKNKFGNQYTIKLRLNPDDPEQAVKVKSFIDEVLQNKAYLVDEQATQLHYEVGSVHLPQLSFLFELMHQCKQQFGITSFSVSQIKLEHVFTNMVQQFEKSQIK